MFLLFFLRRVATSYHQFEQNARVVVLPYIKPTHMLQHLLESYPWALLGGCQPGQHKQLLASFWRNYRKEHASHAVFQMADNGELRLEDTVPLVFHGDGGRTVKKQPLEVVSLQSVLGLDTDEASLTCTCQNKCVYSGKRKRHPLAQRLNLKNNSYCTHFLMFALPSKKYKQTPGILHSLLRAVSENMAEVCRQGLPCVYEGEDFRFNFAILGIRGDQEWHQKSGLLSRSYMNVGYVNHIKCCSECWAGAAGYPFEDSGDAAAWRTTMYIDPPWTANPPFESLPFEDWSSGAASRFFLRDPFHIFRLGIARNFLGSAIVYLAISGYFDSEGDGRALDDRLARAWASFSLWCDTLGERPSGIRSFSRQKLHIPTTSAFPWVGCKGSDTMLLLHKASLEGPRGSISEYHLRWLSERNIFSRNVSPRCVAFKWVQGKTFFECETLFDGLRQTCIYCL